MTRLILFISSFITALVSASEIQSISLHTTPCELGATFGEILKLDWSEKPIGKNLFLIKCNGAGNSGLDWMNLVEFKEPEIVHLLLEAQVRKPRFTIPNNSIYPVLIDSECYKSEINERTGEPTFTCAEKIYSYKDGKYHGGLNGGQYSYILDSAYLAYFFESIRNPPDIITAHKSALDAFKNGRYQTAALISYQAVSSTRTPYDSIHLAKLNDFGYFLGETCEFGAAEKVLKEVLTVQPSRKSASLNLADVYRYEGKGDSANKYYSQYLNSFKASSGKPAWWASEYLKPSSGKKKILPSPKSCPI